MAGQVGRIAAGLRSCLVILWVALTCVLFSIPVFLVCPFSRSLGGRIGRLWCAHLLWICGGRISVKGTENIDRRKHYVFVANHQSHLDIPTLFAAVPHRLVFIAKKELFYIPFFGWGIAALGHINIDRSNARRARESLTRAVKRLQHENISPVLFPEGTRSADGTVAEFKRGGFTLALESGLDIVPVSIDGTRIVLPKKSWHFGKGTVRILIGKPINARAEGLQDKESLSRRTREAIIGMGLTAGSTAHADSEDVLPDA